VGSSARARSPERRAGRSARGTSRDACRGSTLLPFWTRPGGRLRKRSATNPWHVRRAISLKKNRLLPYSNKGERSAGLVLGRGVLFLKHYMPLFQPATRFSNADVSTPSALPLAMA
jgi:hypothetical protein